MKNRPVQIHSYFEVAFFDFQMINDPSKVKISELKTQHLDHLHQLSRVKI